MDREYWSGLPCPPPGHLPNPGIEPRSPALQVDSLPAEPPGNLSLLRVVFLQVWLRGLLQNDLEGLLKTGGLILDLLSLHL